MEVHHEGQAPQLTLLSPRISTLGGSLWDVLCGKRLCDETYAPRCTINIEFRGAGSTIDIQHNCIQRVWQSFPSFNRSCVGVTLLGFALFSCLDFPPEYVEMGDSHRKLLVTTSASFVQSDFMVPSYSQYSWHLRYDYNLPLSSLFAATKNYPKDRHML